ncbi:ABC-type transport auxiliary lipoprotein family protein [Variovorax sp. HJSM1_2]|uniref:ABC-type transport auxiliary lipoprotein family protein n=1 Tax=Variovorax sp. HJSM1_2 TaxID=3366263 RepID=UPI003BCC3349
MAGAVWALAACSVLPDKPTRPTLFDLGAMPSAGPAPAAPKAANLSPLAMSAIEAHGPLEGSNAMLYRLAYANDQQLRPYAESRWAMAPALLVDQRLRNLLSQNRPVVSEAEGQAQLNNAGALPRGLRVELLEFGQVFSAPAASSAVVRLRATVVALSPDGEKLLAQRQFSVQRDAPSADAPGGVRALAAATDALALEMDQWLGALN